MVQRLLMLSLVLVLYDNVTAQQVDNDSIKIRIDNYLNNSADNGYSGSVLVAMHGEILLSKGYGWADRKNKIPNQPTTVYNIGSVTKQFTAAAILKLMENKKLNVYDKIVKYFPQAPSDKHNITIHQLLTHTSGVSPRTGGFRYDFASKERFLDEFFKSKLIYNPGKKHTYANANYIMLAAIIEKVSHQDYETYLHENLWNPADMNNTGYKSNKLKSEKLAHGYQFQLSKGEWEDWGTTLEHLPNTASHWYSIGKGDIYSNVDDLYRWHLALENNNVLNAESKQILETAYVPENEEETSYYGYGWAIINARNNTKIVTHNGSNGIYFADFIRNIDEGTVIIVLSNILLNRQSGYVGWEIAKMISDSTYIPLVIPKNNYELVFKFMKSNSPEKANQLLQFISKETGRKLKDKSILNRIGFKLISENLNPKWGIALLKLNSSIFPDDGNLWDTLGEGYYLLNDKDNATQCFKKAIELAPKENCHWCKNSEGRLKELNNE